jgi:transcription-repair coupling factor (superfamily II helicase)
MKNKYFILTIILLLGGSVFTGCENDRDGTKEDVEQANQDMIDEQAQFDKEWKQFSSDAELKITANQKKIDELKAAMKTTSANFKTKYENKILTLEQKNIELSKKINRYQYEENESWEEFKKDFNSEADTVEVALNDIFTEKD